MTSPPAVSSTPVDVIDANEVPAAVVDVDVQYSPLTNVMPIRRLGLDRPGAAGSFVMAWVSVPSLAVTLDPQRDPRWAATTASRAPASKAGDGFFTAVIRCDDTGLVVDYPGIARRLE